MSCYLTGGHVSTKYYRTANLRHVDKSANSNERNLLFKTWWRDQIAQFGINTTYYTRNFALSAANRFYGENTVDGFYNGQSIVMAINLSDNAFAFTQFGIQSNDEVEAYIDITTFQETLSTNYLSGELIEPKAGDVFQLTDFGTDRPGGREGNFFEITERVDQSIAQINSLAGHYVFKIKARRHDFSHTDDDLEQDLSEQVTDDSLSGRLIDSAQSYVNDIDQEQSSYFDYGSNDSVYGDYS